MDGTWHLSRYGHDRALLGHTSCSRCHTQHRLDRRGCQRDEAGVSWTDREILVLNGYHIVERVPHELDIGILEHLLVHDDAGRLIKLLVKVHQRCFSVVWIGLSGVHRWWGCQWL